jgi:hypothetical protein
MNSWSLQAHPAKIAKSHGDKTIKLFTSGKARPNEFPTSEVEANPYGKHEHKHTLSTKVVNFYVRFPALHCPYEKLVRTKMEFV